MLYFKNLDSILHYCQAAEVVIRKHVGDVPVDEHFSREQVKDAGLWDTRITASNPENLWVLTIGESREESRMSLTLTGSPFLVSGEEGRKVTLLSEVEDA